MAELRIRLPVDEIVTLEERLDRLVDLADRAERAQARQLDIEHADVSDATTEGGAPDPAARPSRGARRALAVCDAVAAAVAAGGPDRSGVDDHLVVLHADVHDLAEAVADSQPDAADAPADAADASADAAEAPDEVSRMRRRRAGRPRSLGLRTHVTTRRGRGMLLPKRVLARLTCDGDLRLAGIGENGHPADIGRRSRKVPADLRRVLQLRDRHCRFPGCDATRYLHAHHVWHWALGGPTDLDNLTNR